MQNIVTLMENIIKSWMKNAQVLTLTKQNV